ncbi:MAG: hypothetical protein ABIH21_04885 [Patescibacteria group bacterium]
MTELKFFLATCCVFSGFVISMSVFAPFFHVWADKLFKKYRLWVVIPIIAVSTVAIISSNFFENPAFWHDLFTNCMLGGFGIGLLISFLHWLFTVCKKSMSGSRRESGTWN